MDVLDDLVRILHENIMSLDNITNNLKEFEEEANRFGLEEMYFDALLDVYKKVRTMQKSMLVLKQMQMYCIRKR